MKAADYSFSTVHSTVFYSWPLSSYICIFSPFRVREGSIVFYPSAQRLFVVLNLVFTIHLAMLFTVIEDVWKENVPVIWYNSFVDRINPYISLDAHFSSTVDCNLK